MEVTAAMVKKLRELTDCGMMECKKALVETHGDIDAAIDLMRKNGKAKAGKKATRAAAEGMLLIRKHNDFAIIIEVNCETDFVTKNEDFLSFTNSVADLVIQHKPRQVEDIASLPMNGQTVDDVRNDLIVKIGENITIRRLAILESKNNIGTYAHGLKIACLIDVEGGDDELSKSLAMQVVAMNPIYLDKASVPKDVLDKEREILLAQVADLGKSQDIINKMVDARIEKYINGSTLLDQEYVKDPKSSVEKLLNSKSAKVIKFIRFGLGEGVEIVKTDFAAEVKAQAGL